MITLKDIEVTTSKGVNSTEIFLEIYELLYSHRPEPEDIKFEDLEEAINDIKIMTKRILEMC